MTRFEVYARNGALLEYTLKELDAVPCFVNREYVEMDCSKLTVTCRVEDADFVYSRLFALAIMS